MFDKAFGIVACERKYEFILMYQSKEKNSNQTERPKNDDAQKQLFSFGISNEKRDKKQNAMNEDKFFSPVQNRYSVAFDPNLINIRILKLKLEC